MSKPAKGLPKAWLLWLTLGISGLATEAAAEAPADEPVSAKERRKAERAAKKAEKARRKAEKRGESVPADEPELAEDAVAVDIPDDGRWAWVDAMGGEIPTDDQMQAIEEIQAQHLAEQEVINDISGRAPPVAFYRDPVIALATDPLLLDLVVVDDFDIPVEPGSPWVAKWVRYFSQGSGRRYFDRWLARAPRYEPMMREALQDVGLPQDLVYLSMIESGYNAQAYSRAAAAGMWQFMTRTGLDMGLRIDWWVDERRDPEASLDAAITYLSQLREQFGDWRLAWAAYNGGPGRVQRAIGRAGTDDFWTLADGPFLHPETDNYVPKIMAAAIIGKHPERYGFKPPKGVDVLEYDVSKVEGSVELELLAKCAGITIEELRELNPALRRFATPPEGYALRVPKGSRDAFVAALAAVPESERLVVIRHRVRRGDTLALIAQRYGSTVNAIRRANGLRSVNRIKVGWTLVIPQTVTSDAPQTDAVAEADAPPVDGGPAVEDETIHVVRRGDTLSGVAARHGLEEATLRAYNGLAADASILVGQRLRLTEPDPEPEPAGPVHTVRRGETLGGIAKRYGVSLAEVMKLNNIRNAARIEVGQPIRLPVGARSRPAPRLATVHVVRRGETLSHIARKYRVTVEGLMRINGLSDPSLVRVGQRLRLTGDPPSRKPVQEKTWGTHTVRRGESLAKIGRRYGCTVAQLMEWNGLSSTTIQPGQSLRVKK